MLQEEPALLHAEVVIEEPQPALIAAPASPDPPLEETPLEEPPEEPPLLDDVPLPLDEPLPPAEDPPLPPLLLDDAGPPPPELVPAVASLDPPPDPLDPLAWGGDWDGAPPPHPSEATSVMALATKTAAPKTPRRTKSVAIGTSYFE
jgi:hypothetical protein